MITNDELIRAAQRDYHRRWRAENREKVKAAQQRYWLKKARESGSGSGSTTEAVSRPENGNQSMNPV